MCNPTHSVAVARSFPCGFEMRHSTKRALFLLFGVIIVSAVVTALLNAATLIKTINNTCLQSELYPGFNITVNDSIVHNGVWFVKHYDNNYAHINELTNCIQRYKFGKVHREPLRLVKSYFAFRLLIINCLQMF